MIASVIFFVRGLDRSLGGPTLHSLPVESLSNTKQFDSLARGAIHDHTIHRAFTENIGLLHRLELRRLILLNQVTFEIILRNSFILHKVGLHAQYKRISTSP